MNNISFSKFLFAGAALAATAISGAQADDAFTLSTGIDGSKNNIETIASGGQTTQIDTNWTFEGYYDSYNLTRADVFGAKVSNPNGAITDPITSSAATPYAPHYADVITGGNRPGWYNPKDGSQWVGVSPNEQNGGVPIDPPGNYVFRLNMSSFVNPKGGAVTISIGEINADNSFALAVSNSAQEKSYLLTPFATQETWNTPGYRNMSFTFSPQDGQSLDVIVANANDQLSNGKYTYQKNPTGFLMDNVVITQAGGPTPKQDNMVSTKSLVTKAAPGTGAVFHSIVVAAPEPGSCWTMAGFVAIAAWQLRRCKSSSHSREAVR
jgi:hypothetical protein